MKKSKIILVSVLAVVLCIMCVTTTTFSWFTRPQALQGDSLGWNVDYKTSFGNGVTMTTYASTDNGQTYDETAEVTSFSDTTGIGAGNRKCYRTDITNSGEAEQSVSLYLSQLTLPANPTGNFYLGVNGPLKTYKNYSKKVETSSSSTRTSGSTMRIYFQPKSSSMTEINTSWKDKNYYVCYGVSASPSNYTALSATGKSGTYYADIPSNATQLFFSVQDWKEAYQRTQTFTDIVGDGQSQTQSLVFYLNGEFNSSNNAVADKAKVSGANIINYYSTISVPMDKTFSAALASGTDYIGKTVEYYSGSESVFTVDKTSGLITPVATGTAKLYTKVTGESYSDTKQVETTVTVTAVPDVPQGNFSDVPIVTNLKVAGKSSDGNATTESVYWYIKNDSDSGPMTYTIGDVYLTL